MEVAVALAIGADASDPVALARLCQAAEHAARGVPTGILDQISSICGVAGHALLLDCHTVTVTPVRLPPAEVAEWVVLVPTGSRDLATSGYGERVAELARAEAEIGPLRLAALDDVNHIVDPVCGGVHGTSSRRTNGCGRSPSWSAPTTSPRRAR